MKNLHLKNLLNLKVILDQFIKKQTDIFSRVGIAFAYTIFGNNFIPYFWAMYFIQNFNFNLNMVKNTDERLPVLETKVDYLIDLIKSGFAKIDNEITNLKQTDVANEKQINELKGEYSLTKSDVTRMNAVVWVVVSAVVVLIIGAFWGKLTGTHP